ncbi:hypothetical protein CAPTEDRAFT_228329 [Capitella teleta]|uniref:Antistasin-like domain-containing protein n=1 Tax=Capitella teleta TaxID=283909 RepID=R7UVJ2_CAPTE|nr:hypothetical protein CAPTEDRAFT_228329 [Capitella teleta]|eukprot:ELU10638.1 hypothetical protein CAPTEDRAFT_228329 [Capitella teleta]
MTVSCGTFLLVAAIIHIAATTSPDHCPMINCLGCPSHQTYGMTPDGCHNCDCVEYCDDEVCTDDKVCRQVTQQCDESGECEYEATCVDDPCVDWDSNCNRTCDEGQRFMTTPYGCDICSCVDVNHALGIVGQPSVIMMPLILRIITQLW